MIVVNWCSARVGRVAEMAAALVNNGRSASDVEVAVEAVAVCKKGGVSQSQRFWRGKIKSGHFFAGERSYRQQKSKGHEAGSFAIDRSFPRTGRVAVERRVRAGRLDTHYAAGKGKSRERKGSKFRKLIRRRCTAMRPKRGKARKSPHLVQLFTTAWIVRGTVAPVV